MINNEKNETDISSTKMTNIKSNDIDEKEINLILNSLTIEQVISYISDQIVIILFENRNKSKANLKDTNDPLYSNKVPIIKIEDYFIRLAKFSKMEISTLILTYIYIKRFIDKENFIIAFNNIFRLIISCSILAIKFNEKRVFKNSFYAKIAGLQVEDLNNLEYNVFSRLNFNLRVLDKEFFDLISLIYKDAL